MHPSLRVLASVSSRQPLIHFVGKRQWQTHAPGPHPLATPDLRSAFTDLLKKQQASISESSAIGGSSSPTSPKSEGATVYENFWEAPERLWKQDLEEWEVDLVATGGASQYA